MGAHWEKFKQKIKQALHWKSGNDNSHVNDTFLKAGGTNKDNAEDLFFGNKSEEEKSSEQEGYVFGSSTPKWNQPQQRSSLPVVSPDALKEERDHHVNKLPDFSGIKFVEIPEGKKPLVKPQGGLPPLPQDIVQQASNVLGTMSGSESVTSPNAPRQGGLNNPSVAR